MLSGSSLLGSSPHVTRAVAPFRSFSSDVYGTLFSLSWCLVVVRGGDECWLCVLRFGAYQHGGVLGGDLVNVKLLDPLDEDGVLAGVWC